jgi:hypothetical protein
VHRLLSCLDSENSEAHPFQISCSLVSLIFIISPSDIILIITPQFFCSPSVILLSIDIHATFAIITMPKSSFPWQKTSLKSAADVLKELDVLAVEAKPKLVLVFFLFC